MNKQKLLLLSALLIVFVMVLYRYSGFLTLDYLQQSSEQLKSLYQKEPVQTALGFFVLYVLAVALSIPAASLLTLLAGFLFPFAVGLVLVSFASTIGCSLAFLISRYLFRDLVQQKFGQSYERIEQGFEKEGVSYLLSLRLIPLFPFFVVNVVMGLTRIRLGQYFIVSQIGMLPATAVFVYAGQQLAGLESVSGILTPGIWLSLFLLGTLPWLSRQLVRKINDRKRLAGFQLPAAYDYQLIVIGAGAAGLVAANLAAKLKAKVLLVEQHKMGGDCLNTGCIPSKAILSVAHQLHTARQFSPGASVDFAEVKKAIQTSIKTIEPHDSVERYTQLGVDCVQGHAEFVSPREIRVGEKSFTTRSVVIASGASPVLPAVEGIENIKAYTSETIWGLTALPERLLVIGGGAMGCELAQAFALLGSKVVLLQRNEVLLPGEDNLFSQKMKNMLEQQGVNVICDAKDYRFSGPSILNHQDMEIEFDACLFAVGRKANTAGLNLEAAGVELHENRIAVDEKLRTPMPGVFAAGDVCSQRQFTHVAGHQGAIAGINAVLRGLWTLSANTQIEALSVFTDPEYARAGKTEAQLQAGAVEYDVTELDYSDLDRAVTEGQQGVIRVLTQKGSDRILGVAVFGRHAAELVQQFLYLMQQKKGLKSVLSQQYLYPVWSAALQKLASQWYASRDSSKTDYYLKLFHKLRS